MFLLTRRFFHNVCFQHIPDIWCKTRRILWLSRPLDSASSLILFMYWYFGIFNLSTAISGHQTLWSGLLHVFLNLPISNQHIVTTINNKYFDFQSNFVEKKWYTKREKRQRSGGIEGENLVSRQNAHISRQNAPQNKRNPTGRHSLATHTPGEKKIRGSPPWLTWNPVS